MLRRVHTPSLRRAIVPRPSQRLPPPLTGQFRVQSTPYLKFTAPRVEFWGGIRHLATKPGRPDFSTSSPPSTAKIQFANIVSSKDIEEVDLGGPTEPPPPQSAPEEPSPPPTPVQSPKAEPTIPSRISNSTTTPKSQGLSASDALARLSKSKVQTSRRAPTVEPEEPPLVESEVDEEEEDLEEEEADVPSLPVEVDLKKARADTEAKLSEAALLTTPVTPRTIEVTMKFWSQAFPWDGRVDEINRSTFKHRSLRPLQRESVNIAMARKDLLLCLPTGGGKSLCFQLPGLCEPGVTVVVSPLIALINDQLNALAKRNIKALGITSTMNAKDISRVFLQMEIAAPQFKFLYITPERIAKSPKFFAALEGLYNKGLIARFVIDEAHCISEWGHDFRPDYRRLIILRQRFPSVPIMALTGTATPSVRDDILDQLGTKSGFVLQSSYNRPNLWLQVIKRKSDLQAEVLEWLRERKMEDETGIIYCGSINEAEQLSQYLQANGMRSEFYHGELSSMSRSNSQHKWTIGKANVMCTTVAFGLGIDKSDVRFVLHTALPTSIEGYYQQVGRAGRDGEQSECVMFWNPSDLGRIKFLIEQTSRDASRDEALDNERSRHSFKPKRPSRRVLTINPDEPKEEEEEEEIKRVRSWSGVLESINSYDDEATLDSATKLKKAEKVDDVWKYCTDKTTCRRVWLLNYFGEPFESQDCNANCDNCAREKGVLLSKLKSTASTRPARRAIELPPEVQALVQAAMPKDTPQRQDKREARSKRMSNSTLRPTRKKSSVRVGEQSIPLTNEEKEEERKKEMNAKFEKARAKMNATREKQFAKANEKRQAQRALIPSTAEEHRTVKELYSICDRVARDNSMNPRTLLAHDTIKRLAKERPASQQALAAIKGIGHKKAELLAEPLLELFS